jgi:hypothetical protein
MKLAWSSGDPHANKFFRVVDAWRIGEARQEQAKEEAATLNSFVASSGRFISPFGAEGRMLIREQIPPKKKPKRSRGLFSSFPRLRFFAWGVAIPSSTCGSYWLTRVRHNGRILDAEGKNVKQCLPKPIKTKFHHQGGKGGFTQGQFPLSSKSDDLTVPLESKRGIK